jgi:hypothetical protein
MIVMDAGWMPDLGAYEDSMDLSGYDWETQVMNDDTMNALAGSQSVDYAIAETDSLINQISAFEVEMASQPLHQDFAQVDQLVDEIGAFQPPMPTETADLSTLMARVDTQAESYNPYSAYADLLTQDDIPSNQMAFLNGLDSTMQGFAHDQATILNPNTSQAEIDSILAHGAQDIARGSAQNASMDIRASVQQSELNLQSQNQAHHYAINADQSQIEAQGHGAAADRYAQQGNFTGAAQEADAAARSLDQAEHYQQMMKLYKQS